MRHLHTSASRVIAIFALLAPSLAHAEDLGNGITYDTANGYYSVVANLAAVGTEVRVACEMIRAVKEGRAHVINLSLCCQTHDDLPPIAIAAALDVIGEWERDHGRKVVIVAAAGNYGDARPCWPAAFGRVVSVAALAPDLLPAPWSSHGFWVTCSTIGHGLLSTYVAGRESPLLVPTPFDFGPDAWATWSGTSFAAPQITGALARLYEEYAYSFREALRVLLDAGQPVPGYGRALKILPGA